MSDMSFEIGEWVFMKLRAHRQNSVVTRINVKLAARYYGPYPIMERIGDVAYKLKLPTSSRVHPVFHVSLLKKAVRQYHESEELPDLMTGGQDEVFELEDVLVVRNVQKQGEEMKQLLIYWKGKTLEDATWEDYVMLKSLFLQFNLEDKVAAEEGSIDRNNEKDLLLPGQLIHHTSTSPRVWQVYS
ncbi:hypothetical protein L195_g055774, partial [Trifolium pratense]